MGAGGEGCGKRADRLIFYLTNNWCWEHTLIAATARDLGVGGWGWGGGRGDRSHLISIFQQTDLFCRQRSCCHSAGGQLWSTEAEVGMTGQLGWLHGDCTWWTGAVALVFCLCCCRLTSSEAQCH